MRKIFFAILMAITMMILANSCQKDINYAEGRVNPFAALFVVKNTYKGVDVQLTSDQLSGATMTGGVVISDAQNGNMPRGLVAFQSTSRGITRGLFIELGDIAVPFLAGDSIVVDLNGSTLANVNGSLRLRGISLNAIRKVSSGNTQRSTPVQSRAINANPMQYDATLISITNAIFDPFPTTGDTFSGNKLVNDGFGTLTVHTEAGASYAGNALPGGINAVGIVFASNLQTSSNQIWPRKIEDITSLRVLQPSPIVVIGYLADPAGSDSNQEYIQLMATTNIDFSNRPFSIVTTNNAGSNLPIGNPVEGWATGNQRTFKFNLTSGAVTKGEIFYVGSSNKLINGAGSTDISSARWIRNIAYDVTAGDGLGATSTNLLANSGNASGIAVFNGTSVTSMSVPVDVVFYGGNGSIFNAGPPAIGYRITDTDYYDTVHPTTQTSQPFINQGSNTRKLAFPGANTFTRLGGVYNTRNGRWSTGRTLITIVLSSTSQLSDIETGTGITTLEQ